MRNINNYLENILKFTEINQELERERGENESITKKKQEENILEKIGKHTKVTCTATAIHSPKHRDFVIILFFHVT
jgi:hypothetical protein